MDTSFGAGVLKVTTLLRLRGGGRFSLSSGSSSKSGVICRRLGVGAFTNAGLEESFERSRLRVVGRDVVGVAHRSVSIAAGLSTISGEGARERVRALVTGGVPGAGEEDRLVVEMESFEGDRTVDEGSEWPLCMGTGEEWEVEGREDEWKRSLFAGDFGESKLSVGKMRRLGGESRLMSDGGVLEDVDGLFADPARCCFDASLSSCRLCSSMNLAKGSSPSGCLAFLDDIPNSSAHDKRRVGSCRLVL